MKVKALMTTALTTVKDSDPIARVRRLLGDGSFHAVPVMNHWGDLCGIITCADFVGVSPEESRRAVREFMQTPVYTIPENVDVTLVAHFMSTYRIRHLVVARDRRALGIVSTFDLIHVLAESRRNSSTSSRHQVQDPRTELEQHGLSQVPGRVG
tara:strand:+ start:1649 stop:2110 length:462 start_codon:yes stop_codon:yes gene_type:complete